MKKIGLLLKLIIFFIFIPVFSLAAPYEEYSFEFHHEFSVGENPFLSLENTSGKVVIGSHSQNKIVIDGSKMVKAKNLKKAEELTNQIQIKIKKNESQISVYTQYPKFSLFKRGSGYVVYHILVPEKTRLNIKTTSADVEVFSIREKTAISTTSGDIKAEKLLGDINILTSSGDIFLADVKGNLDLYGTSSDMEIKNIEGRVKIDATSGNIEVEKVTGKVDISQTSGDLSLFEIWGDIEASSSSGNVNIFQKQGGLDIKTISGDIEIKTQISPESEYSMESTSGDIGFEIPRASNGELKIETVSGDINSKIPMILHTASRRFLSGILGQDGSKISLTTISGDINLKEY